MDKKEEETQAMDKPKPLEVVSDGDLSEIKKDPEETKKAWEVWLEKRGIPGDAPPGDRPKPSESTHLPSPHNRFGIGADDMQSKEEVAARAREIDRVSLYADRHTNPKGAKTGLSVDQIKHPDRTKLEDIRLRKAWEVWLEKKTSGVYTARYSKVYPHQQNSKDRNEAIWRENLTRDGVSFNDVKEEWDDEKVEAGVSDANKTYVTKPIPDSKGGRGSFQHCINANQDKNNPGGWCKQIERKIGGGKKKGRDEGEKEEVKISAYEKLKRIKDRLQAHNKAKQTKIDKPKDWWDHSKVGRQGDIDQKTGRPWWEVAIEEEERKKKEKKKGRTSRDRKRKQQEFVEAETANLKDKTDYFVEEIRANIIYHNKIFPLVGMIAGAAGKVGAKGAKIGGEILDDMKDVGSAAMQGVGEEAEEQ